MITLSDCLRVLDDEICNWLELPTEDQVEAVAHELLDQCFELKMSNHSGLRKVWRDFDIESAFRKAGYA
jgi:hypothetical protein